MTLDRQQTLNIFRRRAATRYYDADKTVSEENLHTILECGRLSPSSIGSEPWRFVVLQNPALKATIKPVAFGLSGQIDSASHLVVILAKKQADVDSEFIQAAFQRQGWTAQDFAKKLPAYRHFQQHDIDILGDNRTLFDWAGKQTYLALANMLTAAAMMGIDSCPIEGFNYTEVERILSAADVFDSSEWGVSAMVTFGYRSRDIQPKTRRAFDDVVQFA